MRDFQDTKYIDTPVARGLFELNINSSLIAKAETAINTYRQAFT